MENVIRVGMQKRKLDIIYLLGLILFVFYSMNIYVY